MLKRSIQAKPLILLCGSLEDSFNCKAEKEKFAHAEKEDYEVDTKELKLIGFEKKAPRFLFLGLSIIYLIPK